MKKSILLIGLFITPFCFGLNLDTEPVKKANSKTEMGACKHGQCQATAKSTGKRCKKCVSKSGDKYCSTHK